MLDGLSGWRNLQMKLVDRAMIGFLVFACSITLLPFSGKAQSGALKVVKTGIEVAYKARLDAGEQIVAFGTGFTTGVDYIRTGDTKPRGIPNGDNFSSNFFAVCGKKIILANPQNFTVSVFDTETGKMIDIPEARLKLRSISGSMYDGGGIQAGAHYAVVITDTFGRDSSAFKVIDVSGAEPGIIEFPDSGKAFNNRRGVHQVAIDEKNGLVAAVTAEREILVLNFKNPDTEARAFSLEEFKGVHTPQMRFDNGKILFQTNENYPRAILLDTETGKTTDLGLAKYDMALRGGTYLFFAARDAKDNVGITSRAAVGKVGARPAFVIGDKPVDGKTKNNGYVGFGASAAITPDGKQAFIAGMEDVGRTERFQVYNGRGFLTLPDASVNPAYLQASDVVASSSLVAFKVGADNRTTLAYIRLR
jgi:hypothetical protein